MDSNNAGSNRKSWAAAVIKRGQRTLRLDLLQEQGHGRQIRSLPAGMSQETGYCRYTEPLTGPPFNLTRTN
jgi:hypothetical protein